MRPTGYRFTRKRGVLRIEAEGRSARGTKFLQPGRVELPDALSRKDKAALVAAFIKASRNEV